MKASSLRIGIVAGEASGDLLGAGFIHALKEQMPHATFEGIGGPLMMQQGCKSLFPLEKIAVMGISEVIKHIPSILSIRKKLLQHFLEYPPDVFIGIDAPDFNLPLEAKLKAKGITTVHYNSPTLWAWREKRIHKIAKSVNLMLTLFPFEKALYDKYQVPALYIGHPLADLIPEYIDKDKAREKLGLPKQAKILALLPGSREMEIDRLGPVFLEAARNCHARFPDLISVCPMINEQRKNQWQTQINAQESFPLKTVLGQSRTVMAAADVILLASGTATLEALLLQKPMICAYKVSAFSYWLGKKLIKINQFALPNILAGERIVPEYIQEDANASALTRQVLSFFENPAQTEQLQKHYAKIRVSLQQNANHQAAAAVLELIHNQKEQQTVFQI